MNSIVLRRIAFALAVLTATLPSFRAEAKPPNVLFIMADDLNCDLGCYGHSVVKSPQIDRLAARGVRFERAYCQYPVCNPSRTSLLSGRRPQTTRVVDNITPTRSSLDDTVMLPEHFRKHGYTTLKLGKIFHTGEAFEDPRSWDMDYIETSASKNPPREQVAEERWGRVVVLEAADEVTWDGSLARRGVKELEQAAAGAKPFFLAVGFRRPHAPYIAPRRYFNLYPTAAVPPLVEPTDHLARIPRLALPYICNNEEKLDGEHRPGVAAAYYASASFMDAQVGVLLDCLDRLALWDNTVVVFLSDHGYQLGEHGGLWHKMTLFEPCCRVPLVIAAPGIPRGQTASGLVESIDLYPTLVELCGLPTGTGLEGTSLVPLLRDPKQAGKRAAQTVVSRVANRSAGKPLDPGRLGKSLRTDRWRYTEWPDGGRELYDHQSDPNEYRNLADSAEHAAVVAEHHGLLASP
ncbi:MAG: sulfatase [Planctomycetia bacterium]|nr:sulfatase [Planctomycetia bacterium]